MIPRSSDMALGDDKKRRKRTKDDVFLYTIIGDISMIGRQRRFK